MAIKIDLAGNIQKVTPVHGNYFNVSALEDAVGGWPGPTKIGPIWVIRNESIKASNETMNTVASEFFGTPVYGDVLALSVRELPPEWDLMDEWDLAYTAEQIDEGIIKAVYEKVPSANIDIKADVSDGAMTYKSVVGSKQDVRKEYIYRPSAPTENIHEDVMKDRDQFLIESYDFIMESYENNFDDFVLYEDEKVIIRVYGDDNRKLVLEQILELFIGMEEYEKCAKLRDILNKYYD